MAFEQFGSASVNKEIQERIEKENEGKINKNESEKKVSISEKLTEKLKNIFSKGSN